jgi:hypothetical protein
MGTNNSELKPKADWLTATEKSLRITYWVTKIGLAVAGAKQLGLLDWLSWLG